jgi:peptidoglycan/xylan/chitin deacetylase (PgdA/CDA1 family)
MATNGYSQFLLIDDLEYPKGIQMAVNVTVDFDAQINRRLQNEPMMELTQGEFGGRVGIWRLLDLFDQCEIKTTIFAVGRVCQLYPEALKEAARRGHEIANHTWEHRVPSDIELERDHLDKSTSIIGELCGKRPVGSRSGHKRSLLKDHGYLYTSDAGGADDVPYYLFDDNKDSYMLNLPYHYVLDDAMYFHFGWYGSGNEGQRLADPCKVSEIWLSAFRQMYKMGRYMNIVLHDFVSGRSMRIAMLETLI